MKRIRYEEMVTQFKRVLISRGLNDSDAADTAEIFAQNSLAGVYSHGLNRFPQIIKLLDTGHISPHTSPTCELRFGAMERWNGHKGLGPLNARKAMKRACELAHEHGIGLVALGNNNHWLRGGTYGWEAADDGCIGICWANTMPNMPAWGGRDIRIGNNPFVIAIPSSDGNHAMVDMALSQFSYGKLEAARLNGDELPVPGGYDTKDKLTTDPAAIEETRRLLPVGYWKGSGLAIMLDLVGAMLSGGNSTCDIGKMDEEEGVTHIMMAIDPGKFAPASDTDEIAKKILADIKESTPLQEDSEVLWPGERAIRCVRENRELGIPVVEEIWNNILSM